MTGTISEIFGWVRSKLLSYFLIVAILLFGVWAQGELSKISEIEKLLNTAERELQKIDENLQKLRNGTDPASRVYARALQLQQEKEQERSAYKSEFPVLTWIPLTAEWKHLKALDVDVAILTAATVTAGRLVDEKVKALSKAREVQIALKAKYDDYLQWARKWRELLPTFWLAAGILAFAIATGIAIKVFLYFVIAPLASGRPPIQILPAVSGIILSGLNPDAAVDEGKVSKISLPLFLKEDQELLVRPEYLQSTSSRAKKRTQWFLNSAFPYASLLSGMFLLTRVQSPESDAVVVSSTKDPLGDVGVIELPDGSAFVCQPRALAGVIQHQAHPIRITRHWRIDSLQSWLTLQLRFLVFHGPGQLIVRGCRGVRMETARKGRIINQAATLGFSANICYANTRCETFMSYWMGTEDLFNDIFTGENGSYVYEEMPDGKHKSGIAGRGLEGLIDAGLKVFGI